MGSTSLPKVSTRRLSSRSSISSVASGGSDRSLIPSTKELLSDPLLSAELPSLLPHHGRQRKPLVRRCLQVAPWILVGGLILWGVSTILVRRKESKIEFKTSIDYIQKAGEAQEMIHAEKLPDEPMPIMITDERGTTRWTVSIPSTESFPLKPNAYASLCAKADDLHRHLDVMKHGDKGHAGHFGYYHNDQQFMDVGEAEEKNLLPKSPPAPRESLVPGEEDHANDGDDNRDEVTGMCKRSLTFVMETTDAGFGGTMMGLWMAYGLAKKEGRAFFIDDRNWAYGKYETFFSPPPKPACLPPPESHRLPCPHQAQHLLVSAATNSWVFGHNFNEEYEDARGMEVMRQKFIFAMLRDGYENLFSLAAADAEYVKSRVKEFDAKIGEGLMIGIHVRHGDRHPLEFQYQKSYIPLEHYVDAARTEVEKAFTWPNGTEDHMHSRASKMVLASDDPDVYTSVEFSHALRAQEQIVLASKTHIDAAQGSNKFIDDNLGWEGGFFKDVFWSLGDPEGSTSARSLRRREEQLERDGRLALPEAALQLRGLVGRSYLLDLAVVGASDRIVCTVSSIGCRLLAVMMGWEESFVNKRWVNVDGDFDWKGIVW